MAALDLSYGIYFPDQGWNPGPLQGKRGVLATGPPGKSVDSSLQGTPFWLLGKRFKFPKPAPSLTLPRLRSPVPLFCPLLLEAQLPRQETPFLLSPFCHSHTPRLSPTQLTASTTHPPTVALSPSRSIASQALSHPALPELGPLTQLLPLQPNCSRTLFIQHNLITVLFCFKPPVVS